MAERVRVGIVGTSWWAEAMHLPSLSSHPQAETVALCGRNEARARQVASTYAVPNVFTDYRAMIEHAGLDALVVAAPDDQHFPIVMDALDAGLHVLCEKPLASTAEQARAMLARAEAAGVVHMVMFTYRWVPEMRYLRDLIVEGAAGRCFHVDLRYLAGYARDGRYRWRFDGQRAAGVLGDLGAHVIDLARWMMGDITSISAHLATHVSRPGAEGGPGHPANDAASLIVQFASGAHGVIQASAVAHVGEPGQFHHYRFYGDAGTLELDWSLRSGEMRHARSDEPNPRVVPVPDEYWTDADRAQPLTLFTTQPVGDRLFIDAVLGVRPASPTFVDGLKAQQIIGAAFAADRDRRWYDIAP